jgi:hypothetical protein
LADAAPDTGVQVPFPIANQVQRGFANARLDVEPSQSQISEFEITLSDARLNLQVDGYLTVQSQIPLIAGIAYGTNPLRGLLNTQPALTATYLVLYLWPPTGDIVEKVSFQQLVGAATDFEFTHTHVQLDLGRLGATKFHRLRLHAQVAYLTPSTSTK